MSDYEQLYYSNDAELRGGMNEYDFPVINGYICSWCLTVDCYIGFKSKCPRKSLM